MVGTVARFGFFAIFVQPKSPYMDYQPQPQFVESARSARCTADCSRCPTFPASFRRIGEAAYCRFTRMLLKAGESVGFPADGKSYLLFLLSGSFCFEVPGEDPRVIPSKRCVCPGCNTCFRITARDEEGIVVVLSLLHRTQTCEWTVFGGSPHSDISVSADALPALALHPLLEEQIEFLFRERELADCEYYHEQKAAELFMLLRIFYTLPELAYFFQTMVGPRDNFRLFVCANYEKVRSVAELASLAGMSLSAFKRRFAAQFNDSVYHWMMERKAERILADIRDGASNTKMLMNKYEFRYYTQFSRFCKNYLHATPARLIADVRSSYGAGDAAKVSRRETAEIP